MSRPRLVPFWHLFRDPPPSLLAQRSLVKAQVELLEVEQQAEYYVAMARMLEERIIRLRRAVNELNQQGGEAPKEGRE